jgi:lysine-specific demethylase/histidyl-hydroxylase NO66
VFQTHGCKLWEVHPAPGDDGEASETLLEPGLCMYLPTGTPHAARARDTVSLHVTIGINQLTWRTLLDRAVEQAMRRVVADSHLPAGYLEDPDLLAAGLAEHLGGLIDALGSTDLTELTEAHTRSFLEHRSPGLRGALVDRMDLDGITTRTRLRRRPGRPCVLRPDGDRLHLLLGDRRLTVPARITEAVERARTLGTFTPADLGLDEGSCLVLSRRLLREGMLEVVR